MIENKRIGNIEFRKTKSLRDVEYYEFVEWYPNSLYNKQDEFEWDETRKCYKSKVVDYYYCHESSFKHPESCYTISTVEDGGDWPDIKTVGNRTAELDDEEWMNYRELVRYFFEEYDKEMEE